MTPNAPKQGEPDVGSQTRSKLGRYSLRYLVANGGMASIYLAQLSSGETFQKWVAVKTIHPHIANDPRFVRMFLDEARLAARIDHPNVCTVFDCGETEGVYYLAMEYLHGESFRSLARRAWSGGRQLPLAITARVIADAARGLHAAHELRMDDGKLAGVVHRDVSPHNIFVTYGGVTKVVDFGVARSAEHLADATATGEIKGKIAYMAPEQIRSESVDRRTDVWSLGVVLWEVSTGRRLFARATDAKTMYAVLHEEIPRPSSKRPGYPPLLEEAVMHALDRDRNKRQATANHFARELEAYLATTGSSATSDEVRELMHALFAKEIPERDALLRRRLEPGASPEVVSIEADKHASSVSNIAEAVTGSAVVSVAVEPRLVNADEPTKSVPLTRERLISIPVPLTTPHATEGSDPPPASEEPTVGSHARPRSRSSNGLAWAVFVVALGVAAVAAWGWRTHQLPVWNRIAVRTIEDLIRQRSSDRNAPRTPHRATSHALVHAVQQETVTVPVTPASVADTTGSVDAVAMGAADAAVDPETALGAQATHHGHHPPGSLIAAGMGVVSVYASKPGVAYDGARALGPTPITNRRVAAGRHYFYFVPTDGTEHLTESVEIQTNASSVVEFRAH